MPARVMLVDDDALLLKSLHRNLCFDYDLVVAESGADALRHMVDEPPFEVVITDMQMPEMNGVQFISEARGRAPDTSFVMLTGNQDLGTAVDAVNQGRVFRFLNKPCEVDAIRTVIDDAQQQYRLITGEKELLNKTCAGAASLLNEVLQANNAPVFARLPRLSETCERVRSGAGIEPRWQFNLATRLALSGFGCIDKATTDAYLATPIGEPKWLEVFGKACETGGRMVRRIPRLELVGDIITACPTAEGTHCHAKPKTDRAIVQTGSTLLRVAITWDALVAQGLRTREACEEIGRLIPGLMPDYVDALKATPDATGEVAGRTVEAGDLEAGMVLHEDACDRSGSILVRAGSRLTAPLIEKLRGVAASQTGLRPIVVVKTS